MYKIVDELILLISRVFSLKILSGSSLYFVDIMVFIVGYEMECEKSVFNKTGCTSDSLCDWDELQVPVTSYQTGQTVLFVL